MMLADSRQDNPDDGAGVCASKLRNCMGPVAVAAVC